MNIVNSTAHASYSFLLYSLVSIVFLGTVPNTGLCVLALVFGMFPDIDGIFWKLKNRTKKTDHTFQHHLYYPTHWPITYTPLVALTVIAYFLDFYFEYFLCAAVGIYGGHFLFDSISCGDGLNWLAPWGRKFVNLWSSKTDGYHGTYWANRYRKTVFFKLENIAAMVSIALMVVFYYIEPIDEILLVIGIIILGTSVIGGFMPLEPEFEKEPPSGRYNDYRKISDYYQRLSKKHKERIRAWQETHQTP